MEFQLIKAKLEHKEALENLMQYYIYDFSEFIKCDVEEDGRYKPYPLEDYWREDNHRVPYIIKQNDKYVGFVLVRFIESDEYNYFSIAEFFILKKYRREGIGKTVAARIFDLHKGKWEVLQMEANKAAQVFWAKVIDEYTKGNFLERIESGRRIQSFSS